MVPDMRELSEEELSALLSADPKKSLTRESKYTTDAKTGKPSKTKYSYEDRTFNGWFKLPHTYGQCEIEGHDEEHSRGRMCTTLPDERLCCRHCFLGELDKA